MGKIIRLSSTKTGTRITHAKRSLVYFVKNFLSEYKLHHWQEEIIKRLEKESKDV